MRSAAPAAPKDVAADVALFGAIPLALGPGASIAHAEVHVSASGIPNANPELSEPAKALHVHAAATEPASTTTVPTGGQLQATSSLTLHAPTFPNDHHATITVSVGSQVETFVPPSPLTINLVPLNVSSDSHPAVLAPAATVMSPAPATVADAVGVMKTSADALHAVIADLAERLQSIAPHDEGGTQLLADNGLQDIQARVGSVADHLADIQHGLTAVLPATIEHLTATVGANIAAASSPISGTLSHVLDHVDQLTSGVTTALGSSSVGVDTLSHAADPHSTSVAPVTEVVGALGHALDEPLAGANPTAGITTLVGMVSAADVFALHDAGHASDIMPGAGALGSVDLLADIAPHDTLLGTTQHHDGAVAGVVDHLHDGLFGHG